VAATTTNLLVKVHGLARLEIEAEHGFSIFKK